MSPQWIAVAIFYTEVLVVLLLCSPFATTQKWQKIFSSRLVLSHGQTFFRLLLLVLELLFLDAMWEIRKFESVDKASLLSCPSALKHYQMKLLRVQRNLHVTAFALQLSLLLRRLATLQKQQASLQALLQASREALRRRAEGADEAAQRHLVENQRLLEEASLRVAAEVNENQSLRADLRKLTEELEACRRNLGRTQDEALDQYRRCEELEEEHDRRGEQPDAEGGPEAPVAE